jgi:CIC family chloride channel protein
MSSNRNLSHDTQHIMGQNSTPAKWIVFNIYAIIAGLLGGLASIAFRYLIIYFQFFFQQILLPIINLKIGAFELGWFILPILGAIMGLLLTARFSPECKGSGIPELMYAVTLNRGKISERVIPGKLISSALTIATGGSAGREGPAALVGGALGAWVGKILKLNPFEIRILIASGVAGAVAGTFNAPLGGALFGLEVLFHGIGLFTIIPMFLASVAGAMVNTAIFGDFIDFPVETEWPWMRGEIYFIFILFGIAFGFLSWFWKVLYQYTSRAYLKMKIPENIRPIIGAAVTGLILAFYHEFGLTGTGYEGIYRALNAEILPWMMLLLGFLKMLTTANTVSTGGSGGVFGPTLFIGGMFGGFIGYIFVGLFPNLPLDDRLFILIGMGALFSGATQSPINIIVIIGEMTRNFSVVPLLMTACSVSYIVSWILFKGSSIYTVKFERMGINLQTQSFFRMQNLEVDDVMAPHVTFFDADMPAVDLIPHLHELPHPLYPIMKMDHIVGVLDREDFPRLQAISDLEGKKLKHFMQKDFLKINRSEYLQNAMDIMVEHHKKALIVIDQNMPGMFVGVITYDDILKACEFH